jgi:uncharacterized membrane protein
MSSSQILLPKWILIVSGIFAALEMGAGITLAFAPQTIADKVDLSAKGVDFVVAMWASRQFALGVIFAYATFKRSGQMLTVAYLFLLVMFICDLVIGVVQNNNGLISGGVVMGALAAFMLYRLNKDTSLKY